MSCKCALSTKKPLGTGKMQILGIFKGQLASSSLRGIHMPPHPLLRDVNRFLLLYFSTQSYCVQLTKKLASEAHVFDQALACLLLKNLSQYSTPNSPPSYGLRTKEDLFSWIKILKKLNQRRTMKNVHEYIAYKMERSASISCYKLLPLKNNIYVFVYYNLNVYPSPICFS